VDQPALYPGAFAGSGRTILVPMMDDSAPDETARVLGVALRLPKV
jgi:hypothetical protein